MVDEAARRELTIRKALSLFCEREIARKSLPSGLTGDERRIEMSVGLVRFPFVRDLDGFDFAAQPSVDKKQIRELATGRFIANAEAVLLGPPGVGKTHLAAAIGRQASWPAIRCCSCGADPWLPSLPRRTATAGSRSASHPFRQTKAIDC